MGNPKIVLKCRTCQKDFKVFPYRIREGVKFCSSICYWKDKKGMIPTENQLKALAIGWGYNKGKSGLKAQDHPQWKGNKASYISKHHFIYRIKGKAQFCMNCGSSELPEGKKRWFEWANVDGMYSRNPKDYVSLCKTCHALLDDVGGKTKTRWQVFGKMGFAKT